MSQQITRELRARGTAQVIVELKQPAAAEAAVAEAAAPPGAAAEPAAAAASSAIAGIERHFTVSELSQDSALALAVGRVGPPRVRYYPNLGLALGTVTRQGLAGLRADTARVARVAGAPPLSLIRPVRMSAAPPLLEITWGIDALGIPHVWGEGLTGEGVLVGHLDTGVDGRHPALQGAIASFAEFDPLGFEVEPAPEPHDTDEHGTHTAATIAGRPVDGQAVGVAPGAILSSAVVIEGGNVVARVLAGMNRFAGQVDTTRASILSMSLGFRGWLDDFLLITDALRARNILPVFAVGNEGPRTSSSRRSSSPASVRPGCGRSGAGEACRTLHGHWRHCSGPWPRRSIAASHRHTAWDLTRCVTNQARRSTPSCCASSTPPASPGARSRPSSACDRAARMRRCSRRSRPSGCRASSWSGSSGAPASARAR